jgi:dihydropyrimidinase
VADAPLLVVHVTCAGALEEIRRARARGRPVYGETCPQYLAFTIDDLARPDFEGPSTSAPRRCASRATRTRS